MMMMMVVVVVWMMTVVVEVKVVVRWSFRWKYRMFLVNPMADHDDSIGTSASLYYLCRWMCGGWGYCVVVGGIVWNESKSLQILANTCVSTRGVGTIV